MSYFNERSGLSRFSMFPPVIKWLLISNALLFLIGFLPGGSYEGEEISMRIRLLIMGGLWPIDYPLFGVWQYVTYMFLHGGFMHIFFNMLSLWMFGIELEQLWGSKKFLVYYLTCGLGAGVIHSIVTFFMGDGAPTVGASGAIMGVLVAFGMIFPDRIIYAYFFPLRAKYAVLLFAALDLYGAFGGNPGSNIAHFAHLGGALVGFLFLQIGGKMTLGGVFDRTKRAEPPQYRPERARVVDIGYRDANAPPARPRVAVPRMEFGDDQQRIDAILDKISHSGYQNLTEEEKAILLEASKKMR